MVYRPTDEMATALTSERVIKQRFDLGFVLRSLTSFPGLGLVLVLGFGRMGSIE